MLEKPPDVSIHAYVRPAQLLEPIESKLRTLETLQEFGAIDRVTIRASPEAIPMDSSGPFAHSIEAYEEFRDWADRVGVSLAPSFRISEQSTIASSGTKRVLRMPVLSVGVYLNSVLTAVFPHSDGDRHYSVADGIALLKTGDVFLNERIQEWMEELAPVSPGQWTCPDCNGKLGNVQGVRVCHECTWRSIESPESRNEEIPRRRKLPV